MNEHIRTTRVDSDFSRLDEHIASLVKGMLARGDKQSDIAACFLINGGRVSEINTGQLYPNVKAAPVDELPPPGPYPSPYELFKSKNMYWRARIALEMAEATIQEALVAVRKVEQR